MLACGVFAPIVTDCVSFKLYKRCILYSVFYRIERPNKLNSFSETPVCTYICAIYPYIKEVVEQSLESAYKGI